MEQGKYMSIQLTALMLTPSNSMWGDDRSKIYVISRANYSSFALGRGAMP